VVEPKPDWRAPRLTATYYPDASPVPESVAVNVKNRAHTIDVDVTVPEGGAEGVLLAQGSVLGGFSLQLFGGRLRYLHNLYGKELHVIGADRPVPPGRHTLSFRFEREDSGGGTGVLAVDGEEVGRGPIRYFTMARFTTAGAGLSCGYEVGPAVGPDYTAPFRCTAAITSATVTLSEVVPVNPLEEFDRIMAEQ
jgi:arylsulfatase